MSGVVLYLGWSYFSGGLIHGLNLFLGQRQDGVSLFPAGRIRCCTSLRIFPNSDFIASSNRALYLANFAFPAASLPTSSNPETDNRDSTSHHATLNQILNFFIFEIDVKTWYSANSALSLPTGLF